MRIVDLLFKYTEMRALRRETPDDPRARMRALAARFPGALREIDQLTMEVIESRIAALERAHRGESMEPWMAVMMRFHVEMREALAIKRTITRGSLEHPEIARPPRGRLSELVCARIGADLGVSADDVRAVVFALD